MSNDKMKQIERAVANDTAPSLSSVDVLSSLKLFGTLRKQLSDTDISSAEKAIIAEELKYLDAGMIAVSKNPILSHKFGGGFSGCMAVAELLKERNSQRIYNKVIDDALQGYKGIINDNPFHTDVYINKLNNSVQGIVMD